MPADNSGSWGMFEEISAISARLGCKLKSQIVLEAPKLTRCREVGTPIFLRKICLNLPSQEEILYIRV
jgi:hypothetical protein